MAFLCSIAASLNRVQSILGYHPITPPQVQDSVLALAKVAKFTSWRSIDNIDVPISQCQLSRIVDEAQFDSLLQFAPDERSQALALSTSLPHAGDWLNVLPSPSLGLTLHNQYFRHCLDYWLGLRLVSGRMTCAICNKFDAADSLGDHEVGCGGNGDRIHRHDALRDALFSAAQSAALGPRKAVPALIAGSRSRPANIFLPNWCGGQPAALDVTVISPLQSLTLAGAASVKGHALQVAENRKRAAHNANCAAAGVVFLPIAVEALGGWSEEAVFHISKIG